MLLDSGALVETQTGRVIRETYSRHYREIKNTQQMRATLRAGAFCWPGGYPLYLWTNDGVSLCFACGRREYRNISRSIKTRANDGWRVVGTDTNFEDSGMACEHCAKQIPAAYGNDEGNAE